jgi:hypothetical protein
MEKWLRKNLKYITIILLALFLAKNTQSCNRKMSIRILEKNLTSECDSLLNNKNEIISSQSFEIDSLKNEIITKNYMIKDLTMDLKIAGVRVDEAQRRADAVQRTAERVKSNTTIEIKGAEQDSSKMKKIK